MPVHEPTPDEILSSKLKSEIEKWDVLGVAIDGLDVQGGLVKASFRIDAIAQILVDAGITTYDDLLRAEKEIALKKLPEFRAQIEPIVQQERLNAIKNGKRIL